MKDAVEIIDEICLKHKGFIASRDLDSEEFQMMADLANEMIDFCLDNVEAEIEYDWEEDVREAVINKYSLTKFKL